MDCTYEICFRLVPGTFLEKCVVLDTALERAKKLVKKGQVDLIIVQICDRKRTVRAFVNTNFFEWAAPCATCKGRGDEKYCDCYGLGVVPERV